MNSVVAIEPFRYQSLRRASHRKFVIGDLVLDNDVNDGMHRVVRQANTRSSMIGEYQIDTLLLVRRKPLLRRWRVKRIILPDRFVHFTYGGFGVRQPLGFRFSSVQGRCSRVDFLPRRCSTS